MKRERKYALTITEPWKTECHYTFGGFNIVFEGRTPNGVSAKCTVVMHFCDMANLARELWRMVKNRREKIDLVENSLRGNGL